ncbi:MAG TPA: hypothetical protein PL059_03310 [Spirochaetota bacterium]|nr:hypothetical protein [Spirochaetota bacterium]HOJ28078.1 hypothetical protein [Spirochaetota bacterium]
MKRIAAAIFLSCIMIITTTLSSQGDCPFAIIYSNPIGTIGSFVNCRGCIQKIINVSFPIVLIMKTDKYLWYSEIYQMSMESGTIFEGNTILIKGQYLGMKKILYEGSIISLPMVYVTEVKK